jgi:hypothetical protein
VQRERDQLGPRNCKFLSCEAICIMRYVCANSRRCGVSAATGRLGIYLVALARDFGGRPLGQSPLFSKSEPAPSLSSYVPEGSGCCRFLAPFQLTSRHLHLTHHLTSSPPPPSHSLTPHPPLSSTLSAQVLCYCLPGFGSSVLDRYPPRPPR